MDSTHDSLDRGMVSGLRRVAEAAPPEGLTLGELSSALGDRAFGMVLFVLALPVCLPFLYGVPQIVALPMLALSAQMALGRSAPWLPSGMAARRLSKASLETTARGAGRWFGWIEDFATPRLGFLSGRIAERLVGFMFCLFCLSVLVPLPLTNTTPGIALVVASLGLINRDGLLVLAGLLLGTAWIIILYGGLILLGPAFVDLLTDFIRTLIREGFWAIAALGAAGILGLAVIYLWRRGRRR
ncbi:MAG: exopolysaccharide biosynthesis protein [Glycocaulis sp.]